MNDTEYLERKKWFTDRVGKTIYRNKTSCKCAICEHVYNNGLKISDESHATYIHDCEAEYNYEGHPLKYFDTVEERDAYEMELKNKPI